MSTRLKRFINRNKVYRIIITAILALTLLISALPVSAETPKAAHQPFMHGYNVNDIKNWSAAIDLNAKYFRSRVPLAARIPAFAATQAHPALSTEPQVMNLSADYDKEAFFEAYKYNDAFCRNLLNFWQYTDLYGSWHGLPVNGSSTTTPDFGVINLPNPAYTDAAHRNGVKSLGCWFWPRDGQVFSQWVEKKADGTFPVADKMIQMAQYFGFDGYFINQEASISSTDAQKLMEMLKYIRQNAPAGFHLQWYDSLRTNGQINYVNGFNSDNAPWIIDNGVPVCNSIFINYAWSSSSLSSGNTYASSLGLDPLKVLFAGTENDKYQYNPPYDPVAIFPAGGAPRTGWALFGTDMVWNKSSNKFAVSGQQEVFTRERIYWSGPNQDPTNTGRNSTYTKWDGVAHFIPERSVIGSYPFITRFNTGHGTSFFLDGAVASSKEWCNASIQDILPSWQWWTKSPAGTPLIPDFDYSTAYDGGSSLKVSGTLSSTNPTDLRLYKTKLSVDSNVNLSITYKTGTANAPSNMKVGLIFEDNPNSFVYLDVGNTTSAGWNTKTFSLAAYAGKTIATIGLRFESSSSINYSVNIGELALTNAAAGVQPAPSSLGIDQVHYGTNNAELFLSWPFSTSGVWYYDIYRVKPDNTREFLGRIYDEVYYVKCIDRIGSEASSTIELVSVGFSGNKSSAAQAVLNWSGTPQVPAVPTGLTATAASSSQINVSWNASAGATGYDLEADGTVISDVTSPYAHTGLAGNTTHTYRVRAKNSAGSSTWSSSISAATAGSGTITYPPISGNTRYEWIARVQAGGLDNTSGNNSGYGDFTSSTTNMTRGASQSVTLTPGFAGSSYTEYWKIWIDLNKDGDFLDAGEELFSKSGKAAVTGTITIPSGTAPGTTRMRVVMKYNAAPPSSGSIGDGEAEDYTVNIQ